MMCYRNTEDRMDGMLDSFDANPMHDEYEHGPYAEYDAQGITDLDSWERHLQSTETLHDRDMESAAQEWDAIRAANS